MKEVYPRLYVGDQLDAVHVSDDFDLVLTVNNAPHGPSEHPDDWMPPDMWIGLEDGENDQVRFDRAAEIAQLMVETMRINEDVESFIHCTSGISRSPTIAATGVAAATGRPFNEVLWDMKQKKGDINPEPALIEHAKAYLGDRDPE